MGWRHATPAGKADSDAVEAAIAATPRANHLPRGQQQYAGLDRALPIGYGQTNSQPTTVRQMLELLDVQPGDVVLDVGCGSGWTTALLAWLTGPTGQVWGVERVPALAAFATANVEAAGMPWAHVSLAVPHVLGLPDQGPYQRILVSAQARGLPGQRVDQRAPGGVLVVPVAGRMLRVSTGADRSSGPSVEEHGWYRFVPLVEDSAPSPVVD